MQHEHEHEHEHDMDVWKYEKLILVGASEVWGLRAH